MFHPFAFLGFGFFGLFALSGIMSVAYVVLVVWMPIDGILRADAEYPGTNPNRKIFWVLAMVFLHPVAIAYLFVVFLKVKRGSGAVAPVVTQAPCTATAPPAA